MSPATAAESAIGLYIGWWKMLAWAAVTYGTGPFPWWVNWLLGMTLAAAFAAMILLTLALRRARQQ